MGIIESVSHQDRRYINEPLPLRISNRIPLWPQCRIRIPPRSRPVYQDLRRWHRNSPPLRRVHRFRRTRHVALLHRLLTVWLPLHHCIYIVLIALQQGLLLLLVVDRHEAAVWSRRQFGDHSSCDLGCFLGNGPGVACGVDGMAACVRVAAGRDEEGEVEEPMDEGASAWSI